MRGKKEMKRICYIGRHAEKNIDSISDRLLFERNCEWKKELIYDDNNPDIVICDELYLTNKSAFIRLLELEKKNRIFLFITGEYIQPDLNLFDYAIGYDTYSYNRDRFFSYSSRRRFERRGFVFENTLTEEEADKIIAEKRKFCCFIYSNPHADEMRDRLFFEILKYKEVDSLGKHLNNVGNIASRGDADWERKSIAQKEKYKFSIAAENGRLRGGTTEKLLNSFYAHTIPIYWGNPNVAKEYNPNAFINVNDFNDFAELRERVREIDCDDKKYKDMLLQPWMTIEQQKLAEQEEINYYLFLKKIFLSNPQDIAKRPAGTWFDVYIGNFYRLNKKESLMEYIKRRARRG